MTPGAKPGLPMDEYLRLPAVSHSILQPMLDECPRAAWWASWLNPDRELDVSKEADVGSIAHGTLLEGSEAGVAVIDPNDHPAEKTGNVPEGWTNKSIRQARDVARGAGLIPVLAPQMAQIRAMVDAARVYLSSVRDDEPALWRAFEPGGGDSELTILWDDGGTLCRMRPDRISADRRLVVNYKTTATSVDPDRWGRMQMIGAQHYVGAAWYRRGLHALYGVECDYVYLVQSTSAPYLCSLVGVDPAAMAVGGQKCRVALARWQRCVDAGHWPAYPTRIAYPELPAWEIARWEEQQAMELGGRA